MGTIEVRMLFDVAVCGEQRKRGDVVSVPKKMGLELIGRGEAQPVNTVRREVLTSDKSGRVRPEKRDA